MHVSVPEEDITATEKMARIIDVFRAERIAPPHPFPGPGTSAFSTINGGSTVNVVGGWCSATSDVRMLPGQTSAGVKEKLEGAPGRVR